MESALLKRVVVEELLDEVDVCEEHSPAAETREAELIEGLAFGLTLLKEREVDFPFVADSLVASEAANRDDHPERNKATKQ